MLFCTLSGRHKSTFLSFCAFSGRQKLTFVFFARKSLTLYADRPAIRHQRFWNNEDWIWRPCAGVGHWKPPCLSLVPTSQRHHRFAEPWGTRTGKEGDRALTTTHEPTGEPRARAAEPTKQSQQTDEQTDTQPRKPTHQQNKRRKRKGAKREGG